MTRFTARMMLAFALFTTTAGAAFAHDTAPQDEDPCVEVFQRRLEMAKIQVRKQREHIDFETDRLARARRLVERNAMSEQEFERIQRDKNLADLKLLEFEKDVLKAEAQLEVVRENPPQGRAMMFCLM